MLVIIYIVFDHTKFGREYKALRDGQTISVNTGIKEIPNAIICYAISGALMGLVGILSSIQLGTVNGELLNFSTVGTMFTAFLPMFIGGFIGRFSNDKFGYFLAAITWALVSALFSSFGTELARVN